MSFFHSVFFVFALSLFLHFCRDCPLPKIRFAFGKLLLLFFIFFLIETESVRAVAELRHFVPGNSRVFFGNLLVLLLLPCHPDDISLLSCPSCSFLYYRSSQVIASNFFNFIITKDWYNVHCTYTYMNSYWYRLNCELELGNWTGFDVKIESSVESQESFQSSFELSQVISEFIWSESFVNWLLFQRWTQVLWLNSWWCTTGKDYSDNFIWVTLFYLFFTFFMYCSDPLFLLCKRKKDILKGDN